MKAIYSGANPHFQNLLNGKIGTIVDEKYEDADEDSNPEYSMALKKVQDKYNPILHKTIRGETRYSGTFANNLPAPLLSKNEIAYRIITQINKFITNLLNE